MLCLRRSLFFCILVPAYLLMTAPAALAEMEENAYSADLDDYASVSPNDWSFRAGALSLDCGRLSNTMLLTRGNLVPVLASNAIDIGTGTGWELEFEKRLNDDWTLTGRYFRIDSFEDVLTATGVVNGAGVRYQNTVVGVLGAVNSTYRVEYDADLSTAELMAKRQLCEWATISAGVRYVQFDDAIHTTHTGAGFTTRNNLWAWNEMVGFQLGSEVLLWQWNRLEFLAEGAAGVYNNHTRNRLQTITNITRTTGLDSSRTAFVGELNLTARYHLRDHISIEGGYRLLWLDGIAMANEQAIINRSPSNPADRIANSSELFAHGALVNLIIDF